MKALSAAWQLLRDTFSGFIEDEALSWGASIAYYTLFSVAPVLLVVVAIAGLVFGREAAEGAIVDQFSVLMGRQTAEALQGLVESAAKPREGTWATVIGLVVLLIAVSGVFGEVQSAMNAIWKASPPEHSTISRLVRARLVSMGLVVTAGFLLTVSLVASAALATFSDYLAFVFPVMKAVLSVVDVVLSAVLMCGLFAAMFKVLPDCDVDWLDVAIGAAATTVLFEGGKYAIAFYIGQSNVASSYGAAGALIVLLVWIYYSAQIFFFGAELTMVFARKYGSHRGKTRDTKPTGAWHTGKLEIA
jgi:membrane protein